MHRFARTLRTATRALRRNVMRSVLTCLGIIIGVAAVIAMMEIGNGASSLISSGMASMGANALQVYPGTAASGGVSFGAGTSTTLTPEDCEAIMRDCPAVKAAAPVVRARTQIVYGNRNWVPTYIFGTTPAYLEVRDWTDLDQGSPFTDQDVRNGSKVCLLGQTLVTQLFGEEDPIGKEIRVQNVTFKVMGILVKKGSSMFGTDQDDILMAPWTTIKYRVSGGTMTQANQSAAAASSADANQVNSLKQLYPNQQPSLYPVQSAAQQANTPMAVRFENIDQISVQAQSANEVKPAINQITDVLRQRHRIRGGEADDFTVRDMTELTNNMATTTRVVTQLLLAVATISLIVGGIGIMNIMLVSVTERTREIGLRMAVGARGRDILWQFLVEAIVLCLLGGTMGIIFGRGGSFLVRTFMNWPTAVSVPAIIASVVVSAIVGIAFGFYPAWKASRLDPIEALRYE